MRLRRGDIIALSACIVLLVWPFGKKAKESESTQLPAPFPRRSNISCQPSPPGSWLVAPKEFTPYWSPSAAPKPDRDIRLSFEKAADLQKTGAFIGINNQREVIRAFLFIAHALNRTVLVHDLVPHANYINQTLRDPNVIFDLEDLSRAVPTLRESQVNLTVLLGRTPTEYALPWSFRYNIITDRLEEPGSTLYWWKRQRYDVFKQEFGRYWPSLVTIEELKNVTEDVIVFEGLLWAPIDMFLFPPALEAQMEELEKNHLHLQQRIFELAMRVVRVIGKYSSVHFRFGDKRPKTEFQRPLHLDLPDELVERENLYIATARADYLDANSITDSNYSLLSSLSCRHRSCTFADPVQARRVTFVASQKGGKAWLWAQASEEANITLADTYNNNTDYIACIEQVICAFGRKFIPTYESSFSEYVIWLRRWLGISGADRGLRDWNARMRQPHRATKYIISPQDLHRERAMNMTSSQRIKSVSGWISLEDDFHLERISETTEQCTSNATRQAIWHAWKEQKLEKKRSIKPA